MTNSPETTPATDLDPRPVLLEVRDAVVHYGRIQALHGVSLTVHDGELVFVSRSQWSDFDREGALTTPEPAPALISRLRLD